MDMAGEYAESEEEQINGGQDVIHVWSNPESNRFGDLARIMYKIPAEPPNHFTSDEETGHVFVETTIDGSFVPLKRVVGDEERVRRIGWTIVGRG
jgi:hypothetical protein